MENIVADASIMDAAQPSQIDAAVVDTDATDMDAAVVDCTRETRATYQIFANRCVICHISENRGHGGFGGVLSARSMRATGHVVPFDLLGSPVYVRIESGDMPRVGARLTPAEVAHVASWIGCGAPSFEKELDDLEDAGTDASVESSLPLKFPSAGDSHPRRR